MGQENRFETLRLKLSPNGNLRSVIAIVLALLAGGGGSFAVTKRSATGLETALSLHEARLGELETVDDARSTYIERFVLVERAVEELQEDLKGLRTWQDNWVVHGELPVDVQQNERIEELKERIARLANLIRELEKLHRSR